MNEELNKYFHEVILGKCWHVADVIDEHEGQKRYGCVICRQADIGGNDPAKFNPDYCFSLDLIYAVMDKVLENGYGVLIGNVSDGWRVCFSKPAFLDKFRDVHVEAYSATSESLPLAIAMACQKAMEGR
jgi:hypothetical protein